MNESEAARNRVRRLVEREAVITAKVVKGKEQEGEKYTDYFNFQESLKRCPSHRILAIRRGEAEGILKVSLSIDEENALENLERIFIKGDNESARQVWLAMKDGYKRLLFPSIEAEYMTLSKQKADSEAIRVFAENLRQLLLASPVVNLIASTSSLEKSIFFLTFLFEIISVTVPCSGKLIKSVKRVATFSFILVHI